MKEAEYIKRVDELLKDRSSARRVELLHQNTPYGGVLAFSGDWMQPDVRCERVARVLMFHLGEAYFFKTLPDLQKCFEFLRGALLYLEFACPDSDKTYEGLLKLTRLDHGIREILPHDKDLEPYERYLTTFRSITKVPFDPNEMETILLSMTDWREEDVS